MDTKSKILLVANNLFMTKGYDQTSIQNIIEEVGIAKGTFYHHFKSKEELLSEMFSSSLKQSIDNINKEISKEGLGAIEKLNIFLSLTVEYKQINIDELMIYLKNLYSDKNYFYLWKMNQFITKYYSQMLNNIIIQGIKEKAFSTDYPLELSKLIIDLSLIYGQEISKVILNYEEYDNPFEIMENYSNLFMESLERLLGLKKGNLITLNLKPFKKIFRGKQE